MKRWMSLLLAIIMIWGTTARISATPLLEDTPEDQETLTDSGGSSYDDSFELSDSDFFDTGNIMPASIGPSSEIRHEYRFYSSEEEATKAQNGSEEKEPFDIKFLRTGGMMEEQELVEQRDQLFAGWFYKEDGMEKKVPFGNQGWIAENKTFYAYPKRNKVIAVFFSHGSVVHKSVSPDNEGKVSLNDQPGVGEAGKVLKGWSINERFDTAEAAEKAGKLFHFKEDSNPTEVDGTLMLHAIFEDAIRVTFDTHGAKVIPGVDIKAGDNVEVPNPQEIKKEGYTFQYWYVLEDDENSSDGHKEVELATKMVDGVSYFSYQFTKNTTVHAKWKGREVPFHIVFMAEKRPDQIRPGGEKYAFLGSFNNNNDDPNKQKTKGIAGSQIIFDDDTSAPPSKVTSLDKNQFKSYLEETNNTKNLLKYAGSMGVNEDLLKGFHVNKEKTNKKNPIIEGNGLTTKVVYLDRDTVNLRVFKGGKFVDDEIRHPEALGGFKYGQILLEKNENRGWNYLFKTYIKVGNNWRWLGNHVTASIRSYFSVPPFAVESVPKDSNNTAPYMKRNKDKTAWIFEFHDAKPIGGGYTLLTIPLRLPICKQDLTYTEALGWIKTEEVEKLKNHLLPNSETPLIGRMGEMPYWMYVEPVDYPLSDGYTTINTTIPSATSQQEPPYGRPKGCTPSLKDNDSISKLKTLAGVTDNAAYLVMPIIYKKQNYDLQFVTKETGKLESKTIKGIPYNCTIVNPENPVDGDPNIEAKEAEVKAYLQKFTPAKVDPETKEVTNLGEVTKNSQDHLFMGWYLDPGYTIPFDKHMPMPAYNLQVFAKWEPLYHYITVHHLPAGTNGVNNPDNITVLKVGHNSLINTEEEILKNPPILKGRSRADFQGWETYGDVKTEVPSPDGTTGGPFLYEFDKQVEIGFHLYPRWYANKVGVVYAFNYNESESPIAEGEEINDIMKHLDQSEKPFIKENRYYMSEFKYPLDSKVRLRAPFGWDNQGMIQEPKAPENTKAHGKVFLGWKIMYRDKLSPYEWHKVDDLVYYNSEIEFTENNISHKSGAKKDESIGVIVLVAQWGEKKINTTLTLHRNYTDKDTLTKEYEIKNLNYGSTLPEVEELPGFVRENYQFMGWNTKRDGSGKNYKAGEEIYIDEQYQENLNHLYAQWEKYYAIEAEKTWNPNDDNYSFKMGLIRRTAPSTTNNPSFLELGGFKSVPDSLKDYKTDLEDGKMKWEVPGYDEDGKRYSYIIVEVTPDMERDFKGFNSWGQLNVTVNQGLKTKTQTIRLTNNNTQLVDTFTSATVRNDKRNQEGKIIGYDFIVTNSKVQVPKPIISQPYADQKVIILTPGRDVGNQVEKIVVTLPDGTNLELTKDVSGHFTVSSNPDYVVTADPTGKLTISLPADQTLTKDQVITAVAKNADDVASETDSKTVLDALDSFKIDKPIQEKRDQNYNVVIKAGIPAGLTVDEGTTFTLTDDNGNILKDGDSPIVGSWDELGKNIVFKVREGLLEDNQKVKVQSQEPTKQPKLSDLSDALDIDPPVIEAKDIKGTLGVNLVPENNPVTVTDKDLTNLEFECKDLPAGLQAVKETEDLSVIKWQIKGAGKYTVSQEDNYLVIYTATDRFGNKATKSVQVIITDKGLVDAPSIDQIAKGDSSVKITPPDNGDRLVVSFPGNKTVTLTKNVDGSWTDGSSTYTPDGSGKLEIPVPDDGTFNVGDIVTAKGQDSAGVLADSPETISSVGQSNKKTPTPQFAKITVGDKNFKIKPVDQKTEGIITDKLVITIRNGEGVEEKKITLKKKDIGWVMEGPVEITLEMDGEYITVALDEGLGLTPQHSFGATGEDTFHGHAISDPSSINVNAEQSETPGAQQGQTKENGNPTIIGTGEPGADISVYNPNGDLIAGPVKVDEEGNYEIEVPKGSLPENGVVAVKQKEDGKPESDAREVTIDTTAPDAPVIAQPNIGDQVIKIAPPEGADKMTITLPNGSKVELTKNDDGTWTDGGGVEHQVVDGQINLPTEPLKNNDLIKATAADQFGNTSKEAKKVVGNENSFVTDKPEQRPRNANGDVVIESDIPQGSNPADGTTYTLVDDNGDPINTADGQAITATPDLDGKLIFNVPDGILTDGQKVKVKTEEPGKGSTLTDPSEPLDLTGPVITASDITGKVGVAIEGATINTNEAAEISLSPNLPNNLVLGDANPDKTAWEISGKGEFETTTTHTVVAVDKLGNKNQAEFRVTITNKDQVNKPSIDDLAKGDTSVKITPPVNGDTLVVTFPGDKTVTLTKNDAGNWIYEDGNQVTVTADGKVEVPVPDKGTLNVGDTITAQGRDSKGGLAGSPVAIASVRQSGEVTPTPRFAGVMEGDTSFRIKPEDQLDKGIITDKLVITINQNDDANSRTQQITLTKTADGKWTDENNVTYEPDAEGYLTVASIALTQDCSLAAIGEDTRHGHTRSMPTSRSIKAKPCDSGTPGQGGSTEIYLPGNKWTPENIALIKQLKLNQAELVKKQAPTKTVITPGMARLPATGDNTATTTYLSMLALLLGLVGLYLARRRS